jgi:HlyD family secretion protein
VKRIIAICALAGLLAAVLTGCGGAPTGSAAPASAQQQPTAAPLPTVAVPTSAPIMEIALGVSGNGEVKAVQDADLVFAVPGTVAEVKVKEGDAVKKGDLLAVLDTRTFDQQVQQAEAALATARAQESALTEPPRAADIAAARAQVQQAQAALAQVRTGPKQQDLDTAQSMLAAAQINLQATRDRLSLAKTQADAQVQQSALMLTQAQARYAQALHNWEYVDSTGNDPIVPETADPRTGAAVENDVSDGQRENYYAQYVQATAALRQAEDAVKLAQQAAETARQAEISGIQAAEQQVIQAQAAADKLKLPPDKDRLAAAQAGVAQAQAAQARLNPEPRDSQKAMASAGIAQAEASLELAKLNREKAELRAPFDGIVAALNIDPGDPSTTAGMPAIKVVNVSTLRVDVQISDTDIAQVAVGQAVEVRADAMPDTVIAGKVSYIAPTATAIGTLRTYLVRIELADQGALRAGMSVRVDIASE